jgi:hypothetical protein
MEGDQRAQKLSLALNVFDKQLRHKFFTPQRRSWVMSLPTESGEKASAYL